MAELIPVREMCTETIAQVVMERIQWEPPAIKADIEEMIPGLFDVSREVVHKTIQDLSIYLDWAEVDLSEGEDLYYS